MRTFNLIAATATLALLMAGCASTGSTQLTKRANDKNTTQLWYIVSGSGIAHVNPRGLLVTAAERCSAQGYDGVKVSDGVTTRYCREDGGPEGCTRWEVNKLYQCANLSAAQTP